LSRDKVREWIKSNKDVPVEDLSFRAAAFFGRNAETLRRMASTDKDGKPVTMTYETLAKAISLRPFNASLKTLCWKMGDCFMKFSNKKRKTCPNCGQHTAVKTLKDSDDDEEGENQGEDEVVTNCKHCDADLSAVPVSMACFYGQIYRKQKQHLIGLNQSGQLAKTAAETLGKKNIQNPKVLALYKSGMLPDGHIDSMAKRFAVKLFLSNLHEFWCAVEGIPCPQPYSMAILGHAHYICQPEITDAINLAKEAHKQSLTNPIS
jgi:predicted  nucleic acid-binding Zn-ribbon protein